MVKQDGARDMGLDLYITGLRQQVKQCKTRFPGDDEKNWELVSTRWICGVGLNRDSADVVSGPLRQPLMLLPP